MTITPTHSFPLLTNENISAKHFCRQHLKYIYYLSPDIQFVFSKYTFHSPIILYLRKVTTKNMIFTLNRKKNRKQTSTMIHE